MFGKKISEYDSFDNNYVLVVGCFCTDLISISSNIGRSDSNQDKNTTSIITVQNLTLIGVDAV